MKYVDFKSQLKWLAFTIPISIIAGLSSALFLYVLDELTDLRLSNNWLIFLLPFAGLAIGYIYFKFGKSSSRGTNLVIDQVHEPTELLPKQMGFFVLIGTWISHLFGASVGREGTALQISSSFAEIFFSKFKLITQNDSSRKVVLVCAKAAGFSAVFGVPFAGAIFALEVQKLGKLKILIVVPVLVSAFLSNYIVELTGYKHFNYPNIDFSLAGHSSEFWLKLVLLGVIFGMASNVFSISIVLIKKYIVEKVSYVPARPFIGGVLLIIAFVGFGSKYEGLSISLIRDAMSGDKVAFTVFAIKLLVTVIALSFGYIGGEVTPLFVIGATLGAALSSHGNFFDMSIVLVSALGLVAVFAGASNTPFACIVIGIELFGIGLALPLIIVCCIAYFVSVEKGIYHAQVRPHRFKLVNALRFRETK